ncbi:MAG: LamB/YcsF family protein [Verrucomicrobia bacterium]|nr:LamB/YcsF family protein [Verrucomicrobiota bacterium]
MKLDLNCDLGEGEPLVRTRALMRCITSANVACGGHAGDTRTMTACVHLAKKNDVKLGAHPGAWSRGDFGRGEVRLTPDEFELLLLLQVGALERVARTHGVRLHHIKLHGALYHACERDARLRRHYVQTVKRWWPGVKIYALAGGSVIRAAQRAGVEVWEEAFADRAYRADGKLVPRNEPDAVLTNPSEILARVLALLNRIQTGNTNDGHKLPHAQTLCIHSDTPCALKVARGISALLRCQHPV